MKNTVYVRAYVASDTITKTVNLAFRVSDLLEISSDGESITIRKVSCALCGHTENIRQYFRDKWVCDKCAEEISKGVVRDSRFVDTAGSEFNPYDFGDDYRKKTHIWGNFKLPVKNPIPCEVGKFDKRLLHELPELPEGFVYNKGCGLDTRQVRRSITPPGFAKAFFEANQ